MTGGGRFNVLEGGGVGEWVERTREGGLGDEDEVSSELER